MAVEKIALGINLRKNKISTNAGYGKYYPEVDTQKTLSLRGFAQHMVDHGSIYGRAIVEGVLLQITDSLPELVAQGVPVQLGSLGTFYPTAEVAKDAASQGDRHRVSIALIQESQHPEGELGSVGHIPIIGKDI
jgi:hypothetical protein